MQINSSATQLLRSNSFYEQAASKIIKNSIFNHDKLTIDTTKVATQMEQEYPELGRVSVILPLISRRPIVEVQPAQPVLRLVSSSGGYIVDDQGRIVLKEADTASSIADSLPIVHDDSGLAVNKGQAILPLVTVQFIHDVAYEFNAKQVGIDSMSLPAIANELHVQPKGQSYLIKFDIQGGAREQVGAFLAAKDSLATSHDLPKQYIDVRVPEKVFYQ